MAPRSTRSAKGITGSTVRAAVTYRPDPDLHDQLVVASEITGLSMNAALNAGARLWLASSEVRTAVASHGDSYQASLADTIRKLSGDS